MKTPDDSLIVALPVDQGRISPLFDAARRMLVVEIAKGEEHSMREVDLPAGGYQARLSALRALGVEALVCGAISNRSLSEALHLGMRVWSAVTGEATEVLDSLTRTGDLDLRLAMPKVMAPRFCRDLAWVGGDGPQIWGWRVGATRMAEVSRCG